MSLFFSVSFYQFRHNRLTICCNWCTIISSRKNNKKEECMELSEGIRFMATETDKALLSLIAQQDGDASMSATIRRLIRNEAMRRGIAVRDESTEGIEQSA